MAEHWHGKPKAQDQFPAAPPFFRAFYQPFQRSMDSNGQIKFLISLINPRTKLIGILTIGLPAVIILKNHPNQQSTHNYYSQTINKFYMFAGTIDAVWSNKLREDSCPVGWYVNSHVFCSCVCKLFDWCR